MQLDHTRSKQTSATRLSQLAITLKNCLLRLIESHYLGSSLEHIPKEKISVFGQWQYAYQSSDMHDPAEKITKDKQQKCVSDFKKSMLTIHKVLTETTYNVASQLGFELNLGERNSLIHLTTSTSIGPERGLLIELQASIGLYLLNGS